MNEPMNRIDSGGGGGGTLSETDRRSAFPLRGVLVAFQPLSRLLKLLFGGLLVSAAVALVDYRGKKGVQLGLSLATALGDDRQQIIG